MKIKLKADRMGETDLLLHFRSEKYEQYSSEGHLNIRLVMIFINENVIDYVGIYLFIKIIQIYQKFIYICIHYPPFLLVFNLRSDNTKTTSES